jgi:hypothetical protein
MYSGIRHRHEVPPFATRVFRVMWKWRHLAAEAGMFQIGDGVDSGLHNKPAGCGASEAYPSGPGRVNVRYTVRFVNQRLHSVKYRS